MKIKTKISLLLFGFDLLMCPIIGYTQIVNPNEVYTYEQMEKDLLKIKREFPNELSIKKIGSTSFNRNIWAVKLGKGKRNILFIGSHHGREWLTTSMLMVMLEQYTRSYAENSAIGPFSSEIFDDVAIWFVPMLNPDGVSIQQKGFDAVPINKQVKIFEMNGYSPDFTKWKANGVGIDLNRQYPAGWNELEGIPIRWYQFYKGKVPLQAGEVKVITSFTKKIKPLMALSYHSSGREIFWNYHNGIHLNRDKLFAEKVSLLTGYSLSIPEENATGGGFTDWFITTFHQPGMTIEICPLVVDASPSLTVFPEEWKRNELVGIMLAHEAKTLINSSY
jgi:g-D-glutamyl-meso-diaminopimelate peptidase